MRSEGLPPPSRPALPPGHHSPGAQETRATGLQSVPSSAGWGGQDLCKGPMSGTRPTAEAWLPPAHVDMLLGTLLGIVGQSGAHGLPTALTPTACWGPRTVGKEAGLVVLSRGDLQRWDRPSVNQPRQHSLLLLGSCPDLRSNRMSTRREL